MFLSLLATAITDGGDAYWPEPLYEIGYWIHDSESPFDQFCKLMLAGLMVISIWLVFSGFFSFLFEKDMEGFIILIKEIINPDAFSLIPSTLLGIKHFDVLVLLSLIPVVLNSPFILAAFVRSIPYMREYFPSNALNTLVWLIYRGLNALLRVLTAPFRFIGGIFGGTTTVTWSVRNPADTEEEPPNDFNK